MTENQTNAIIKNPNTKKALAVLQKFALMEAQYKALEKESKEAAELIKQSMIDTGVTKVSIDTEKLSGFITLAERVNYKADDIMDVDVKYLKSALDTEKIKAQAVLTGSLPDGITESLSYYIVKKFKVLS